MSRNQTVERVPYAPGEWTESQLAMHVSNDLDQAMHLASCLAGGWYRRPVRVDCTIVGDREHYEMRPADVPRAAGAFPCYIVTAFDENGMPLS